MSYAYDSPARKAAIGKELVGLELLHELMPAGVRLEPVLDERSQVLGVDYLLYQAQWRATLELKADHRAHETGNAFVELLSDSEQAWPGWAYTGTAQYLAYLVVATRELLVLPMSQVKARLNRWRAKYRVATCALDGHKFSQGLLVPLDELRRLDVWDESRGLRL